MYFDRSNLPFDSDMKNFWQQNGYLVIENFKTAYKKIDIAIKTKININFERVFLEADSYLSTFLIW